MRIFTTLFATSLIVASPLAAQASADPCGELLLVTVDEELAGWLQLTTAQVGELQAIRDDANARIAAVEQDWQLSRERELAAARAVAVLTTWQRERCADGSDAVDADSQELTSTQTVIVQRSPVYLRRPIPRQVWRGGAAYYRRRPALLRRGVAPVYRPARPVLARRAARGVTVHYVAPTYRPAPVARRAPRATTAGYAPAPQRERHGRR